MWRTESKPDEIDMFLGTIDEKWLIGGEKEGDGGGTSMGKTLGTPMDGQYYYENTIKGVTDFVQGGKRYLTHPSKCEGF